MKTTKNLIANAERLYVKAQLADWFMDEEHLDEMAETLADLIRLQPSSAERRQAIRDLNTAMDRYEIARERIMAQ